MWLMLYELWDYINENQNIGITCEIYAKGKFLKFITFHLPMIYSSINTGPKECNIDPHDQLKTFVPNLNSYSSSSMNLESTMFLEAERSTCTMTI